MSTYIHILLEGRFDGEVRRYDVYLQEGAAMDIFEAEATAIAVIRTELRDEADIIVIETTPGVNERDTAADGDLSAHYCDSDEPYYMLHNEEGDAYETGSATSSTVAVHNGGAEGAGSGFGAAASNSSDVEDAAAVAPEAVPADGLPDVPAGEALHMAGDGAGHSHGDCM